MKPPASDSYAKAFCATCHSYQLSPSYMLQMFADAVSVHGFLNDHSESATHLAARIFSSFSKVYKPVFPLIQAKRRRAIHNIQSILKVMQSLMTEEEKAEAYGQITDNWFRVNQIQ